MRNTKVQWPSGPATHQIDGLRHLGFGWNGVRGAMIDKAAIDQAMILVSRLAGCPDPAVSPTPGGGVLLRWAREGREVEVVFHKHGGGEYLIACRGAEDIEGTFDAMVDAVADTIRKYVPRD